jgi:hypothetical protein
VKVLALLADSFRETLSRKSFLVMAGLAGLLILFFASISFRKLDGPSAIQSVVEGFNVVARTSGPVWARRYDRVRFEVGEVRQEEGYRFVLRASPPEEAGRLIHHWQGIRLGKCKDESDPVPEADAPVDPGLARRFLESRFREELLPDVDLEPIGPWSWSVRIRASGARALESAEEMSFLFGAVTLRPRLPGPAPSARRYLSSADFVTVAEIALGEWVMGFAGMLVAIIATAGSVPRMLEKGSLDLLLARPLGRTTLLLLKYLGGCLQVFLGAAILIGGSWLAFSARTGHWNASFLLTILTLTFFFAVLHSVGVLVGVATRNGSMSAVATLLTWAACFGVGQARMYFASPDGLGARKVLVAGVQALYLLLPKTWDLGVLNQKLIAHGQWGESTPALPEWVPTLPVPVVFVTSAAFALGLLAVACCRFERQDY